MQNMNMTSESFRAIARYAPIPMMLVDGEGRVLAMNASASDHLRLRTDAGAGQTLQDLVLAPEARLQEFLAQACRSCDLYPARFRLQAAAAENGDYVFEGALLTSDPDPCHRRLIVRFQKKRELRKSFLALNQKIKELMAEMARRQALEEEKSRLLAAEQEARREAEQANRSKDEFLAAVSHELRTPMAVIKGWADMLHEGMLETSEYPEVFEAISRNANLEVQLIDELLDMSRIVTGKLTLSMRPVELRAIVAAAMDSVRFAADAKQVSMELHVDAATGPVAGDPERLQQVVWNLLMNAIKFSEKGGKILISLVRRGSHAELSVEDRGIGIGPAFLPYVFERFRQEDGSHTRMHGGLGLGLTIVRHIVEMLGGKVTAASEGKGQGAVFTITLPLLAIPIDSPCTDERPSRAAEQRIET